MPRRHRSQSDQESSVCLSSRGHQTERAKEASASRREINRRERYSSGYGSLDESTDFPQNSSRSSSTRSHKTETSRMRSPPPNYYDEPQAPEYERTPSTDQAYYSDTQNCFFDDRQTDWSSGSQHFCSTVVEVPEEVGISHLRSSGRDGLRHAPDMILGNTHRLTRGIPLKVQVNDETIEYELLRLVNDNDAIELLKEHTKKDIFLCTDAVKKCEIHGRDVTSIFRYQLMTLAEEREVLEKTKPYTGEAQRKSHRMQSVWDYEVDIPKHFRDCSESFVLSNTERLNSCKNCNETGKVKCRPCSGMGSKPSDRCHGHKHGPMSQLPCMQCSGGFETCNLCHGSGRARCDKCEGKCKVVVYKVVKVTWKAKKSMYMDACHEILKKHLLTTRGSKVFSERRDRLDPISEKDLLHETIRHYSRSELQNHSSVNGKIVQQKHLVDVIPIQLFECCYKGKTPFQFYVIGLERKIFVPNFPKKRLSLVAIFFSCIHAFMHTGIPKSHP